MPFSYIDLFVEVELFDLTQLSLQSELSAMYMQSQNNWS